MPNAMVYVCVSGGVELITTHFPFYLSVMIADFHCNKNKPCGIVFRKITTTFCINIRKTYFYRKSLGGIMKMNVVSVDYEGWWERTEIFCNCIFKLFL